MSITTGISSPTDIVLASEAEGYGIGCLELAPTAPSRASAAQLDDHTAG